MMMRLPLPTLLAPLLGGAVACGDPPLRCPADTVWDQGACVPAACGQGVWGDLAPEVPAVYVNGSAAAGGDGSRGAPLVALDDALALAGSTGGAVRVAAGTYRTTLTLGAAEDGLALTGRCPELVRLEGEEGAIVARGDPDQPPTWSVSGVTLAGGDVTVALADAGTLALSDVRVVDAREVGLLADGSGSALTLTAVTVTDAGQTGSAPSGGVGLQVVGGTLTADGLELTGSRRLGLYLEDATADLRGATVSRTGRDGAGDVGLRLVRGALVATDLALLDNQSGGLSGEGADITLVDCVISGNLPDADGAYGYGLDVVGRPMSSVSLTGCSLSDNAGVGINADSVALRLDAVEVTGTTANAEGTGEGVEISNGSLTAVGLVLTGQAGAGIGAQHSTLDLDGLRLESATGPGLLLYDSACDPCSNLEITAYGVGLRLEEGSANIEGLLIPQMVGDPYGTGLIATAGAELTLSDAEVHGARGAGIGIADDATATLREVWVEGTRVSTTMAVSAGLVVDQATVAADGVTLEGNDGPGIYAFGAALTLDDLRLVDNAGAGLFVVDSQTTVSGDSAISGTGPQTSWGAGVGVIALWAGGLNVVQLADLSITGSARSSVYLDGPGAYVLDHCTLEGGVSQESTRRPWGNAVVAVGRPDAPVQVLMVNNTLSDSPGGAVFLQRAQATLLGNTVADNTPDVVQQVCVDTEPIDCPTGWACEVCPSWDYAFEALDLYLYFPTLEVEG